MVNPCSGALGSDLGGLGYFSLHHGGVIRNMIDGALKELKQASEAHRFQQRLRLQRLQRRSSSTMQLASLKQLLPEELIALRLAESFAL